MKRIAVIVLTAAWTLASSGCISVYAKTTRIGTTHQFVSVGEEVYMVDKIHGRVWRIDLSTALPFEPDAKEIGRVSFRIEGWSMGCFRRLPNDKVTAGVNPAIYRWRESPFSHLTSREERPPILR